MYLLKALNKNLTVLCFDSMLQIIHRIPRINSQLTGPFVYSFDNSPKCVHTSAPVMKKRLREVKEMQKQIEYISPRKRKPVIEVWEGMTIEELGKSMGKDADHVFQLMEYVDNTVSYKKPTDVLDWAVITDIVEKARLRMKHRTSSKSEDEDRDLYPYPPASEDKLVRRPPIVTIMGHVDHGKTTLLDYLRKSSIVDSEFGGITQHIGAFSVTIKSGSVTFLDTPGHAAFKAMRSRGAQCTDIVVLVVAADDGVMEQTEESIRMARNANGNNSVIRLIYDYCNKIIEDYNEPMKVEGEIKFLTLTSDIVKERTKKMLAIQDLVSEDMGGNVQCVPISALKGTNIEELVEAILVQAEISNLRSDPDGFVEGVVLESRLDPHHGKLATAVVRRGTMRKGTIMVAGQAWGRVRFMLNDQQKRVAEATPSTPVEVSGWKDIPSPGDLILEVQSEKRAHEVVRYRTKMAAKKKALEEDLPVIEAKLKEHQAEYKKQLLEKRKLGLRKLRSKGPMPKQYVESYTGPSLNIIIKADVEGSLEALLDVTETYHSSLCKLDVVHFDVGAVSKSDVELAELFNAVVYNFNVGVLPDVSELAEKKNISIRPQNIIYRFLEDVRDEINSRLPEKEMEEITGEAVVLKMFTITDGKVKNIPVAGCRCVKGDLKKTSLFRVMRKDVEIFRGMLHSMRNLKTEVTLIKKEQECGLRFQESSYVPEPGDVIQSFRIYTVPQEIDWDPFRSIR